MRKRSQAPTAVAQGIHLPTPSISSRAVGEYDRAETEHRTATAALAAERSQYVDQVDEDLDEA